MLPELHPGHTSTTVVMVHLPLTAREVLVIIFENFHADALDAMILWKQRAEPANSAGLRATLKSALEVVTPRALRPVLDHVT